MRKLFVDRSIAIDATASRVWDVLTQEAYTTQWASEFSVGGPPLRLVSGWALGDAVNWIDSKGGVVVEGIVTALEHPRLLRFTVRTAGTHTDAQLPQEAISCTLTQRSGRTTLWISHGDFASEREPQKVYELTAEIWERALPKIRKLAESPRSPG